MEFASEVKLAGSIRVKRVPWDAKLHAVQGSVCKAFQLERKGLRFYSIDGQECRTENTNKVMHQSNNVQSHSITFTL